MILLKKILLWHSHPDIHEHPLTDPLPLITAKILIPDNPHYLNKSYGYEILFDLPSFYCD